MKLGFVHALWLLLLVPGLAALVVFEARKRRARLARLGDLGLIDAQSIGVDERRRWVLRVSMIVAFVGMVLGLAGPKFGDRTELLPRRGLDVVFAVDVSRSMRARDVLPDRLERAKAEIIMALDRLGENRIGLIAFAGTAFVQCPLTTDVEALRAFTRTLAPEVVPQGGTMLAAGLDVAANLFDAETEAGTRSAGRVLVVVTDGEDHEGDLEKAAERLKKAGVHTFFIGIGSGLGEPIPLTSAKGSVTDYLKDRQGNTVMTRMSPEVLEQLASLTGGRFIDGTRDPTLGIDHIESQVAQLEKRDLEARVRTTYVDRSAWPFGLGLLALLFGFLFRETGTRKRRAMPIVPLGLMALLLWGATPAQAQSADRGSAGGFTRTEPHLVAGFEKLQQGDFAGAIDAYRSAETPDREERAVVEYNVGVALLEKARRLAEAAGGTKDGEANPAAEEIKEELTTTLRDADLAFSRAKDLSSDKRIRSDAALARGNTKAASGDMKGAVGDFRDAVVENPQNGSARANLRHALRALAAQPPPPPNEDGEGDEDQDKEEGDEEEKDEEQKDQGDPGEKKDDEKEDDEKKDDEKKDDEKKDDEKKDDEKKDDEKKDDEKKEDEKKDDENKDDENKDDEKKDGKDAQPPKPEDLTKEEARRILDALRQREKPLAPFAMRGKQAKTRRPEKEW